MPRANTLPVRIRLAALTISSGVTWLRVPIWSSLPQRPQLESFFEASAMACLPTLMSMAGFLLVFCYLAARECEARPAAARAILRRVAVFQQAVLWATLTGPPPLAHDPASSRPVSADELQG